MLAQRPSPPRFTVISHRGGTNGDKIFWILGYRGLAATFIAALLDTWRSGQMRKTMHMAAESDQRPVKNPGVALHTSGGDRDVDDPGKVRMGAGMRYFAGSDRQAGKHLRTAPLVDGGGNPRKPGGG